jgi:hypothetical protein
MANLIHNLREAAKYGRHYKWWAGKVVARPGLFLVLGWIVPALFSGVIWGTIGAPAIGTDFSAYMKTDGIVADRHDAFDAAHAVANAKARRLSEVEPLADLELEDVTDALAQLVEEDALRNYSDVARARGLNGNGRQRKAEWSLDLYYRVLTNGSPCDADSNAEGCNVLTAHHVEKVRSVEKGLV